MTIIRLTIALLLANLSVMAWSGGHADEMDTEKIRKITKEFTVRSGEILSVDNQFGAVNVNLWEKPSIRVEIRITAIATSESRAMAYLEAVNIQEERRGEKIMLQTIIGKDPFSNRYLAGPRRGTKSSIQIDYTVSMPKETALIVKNQFGDTHIPSFQAPLTIDSRYGGFFTNNLENVANLIEVSYGSAKMGKVAAGKMDFKYSDLHLDHIKSLELSNKFGEMHIGDVTTLDADIDYSNARIGTIRGQGNIRLRYSGDFRIDDIRSKAEEIRIEAAYSSVVVPADANRFDIEVSYGSFRFPASIARFTQSPGPNLKPNEVKRYKGMIGDGSGTKVVVHSRFGNVEFKK